MRVMAGAEHDRRRALTSAQRRSSMPWLAAAVPAREEATDHAAVGHEAASVHHEHLADAVELREVREDVEDARADDRPHGRPHVNRAGLLFRNAILLREAHRDEPPDDERRPEHDAVRVDGDGRPGMREALAARRPRARLQADEDLGAGEQIERRRRQLRLRAVQSGQSPPPQVPREGGHREHDRHDEQQLRRDIDEDGAHGGLTKRPH